MKKGKRPRVQKDTDFVFTSFQPDNEVTGSAFLLEIVNEGLKILIDCGAYQDSSMTTKQVFDINSRKISKIPWEELTHIVISHAHADHCGLLPLVMREELGFRGKIICTEASQPLISLNCQDAAFVMGTQVRVWNKANPKKPIMPLFGIDHASELVKYLQGYGYNEQIPLSPNVSVELIPTGHLLGDASIIIEYRKDEYHTRRIFYTGDTNAWTKTPRPFTKQFDTSKVYECDTVICESTYGCRKHSGQNAKKVLEQVVESHVIKGRGVLLIPTFAIGRSAQVAHLLKEIWKEHPEWEKINIPIYLAGMMMGKSFTVYSNEYFQRHFMDEEWQNADVFKWGRIQRIDKFNEVEEKLIDNKPKIILASSGMCTGGYTTYLCQQMIGRPNVALLFSGYVGEGTTGRAILETLTKENKYVTIQGVKYRVRCQLPERLELSGHADSTQIFKLITTSFNQNKLKNIIIVHGGEEERQYVIDNLKERIDMGNKTIRTLKEHELIRF